MKLDVLGLGMLGAIQCALDFVSQMKGCEFSMQDVPAEDSETYEMITVSQLKGARNNGPAWPPPIATRSAARHLGPANRPEDSAEGPRAALS